MYNLIECNDKLPFTNSVDLPYINYGKDNCDFSRAYYKLKEYSNRANTLSVKCVTLNRRKNIKIDNEKPSRLVNAKRSARRAKVNLLDLCYENRFSFFITLTFGVIDRLNDDLTKSLFFKWRKEAKRKFPDMKYIAVPEYHKKGGLHFHLLVGGVSAEDLNFVDSGKKTKSGMTIFNVTCWKNGFSTATIIENLEATQNYIAKYLSKGGVDPRFYRQKRFYSSHNLRRPLVKKWATNCVMFDPLEMAKSPVYNLVFADIDKAFYVFEVNKFNSKDYLNYLQNTA